MRRRRVPFAELQSFAQFSATGVSSAQPGRPCERPTSAPRLEPHDRQILEWASSIPISLFEAVADLDAGPIHLQQEITLQGHELVDEWRALPARDTFNLCLVCVESHREVVETAKTQRAKPAVTHAAGPLNPGLIQCFLKRSSSMCCESSRISVISLFSMRPAGATS